MLVNNHVNLGDLMSYGQNAQVIDKLKPKVQAPTNNSSPALDKEASEINEELMEACKSFETYLVEQTIKEMQKTVLKDEEDSDKFGLFQDLLYKEYATSITEQGDLGLAKELYESMKRNMDVNSEII